MGIRPRTFAAALVSALALVAPTVPATAAPTTGGDSARSTVAARVPITQQAVMLQDKVRRGAFQRACPGCNGTYYSPGTVFATSKGNVVAKTSTFKLKERVRKHDYYFVQSELWLKGRKGDKDWGTATISLQSTGKVKPNFVTTSKGQTAGQKTTCKTYPIDIGAGFGPVSVGTTVGSFRKCDVGTRIVPSGISRGTKFNVYQFAGAKYVTAQRFVRVGKGKRPTFKATYSWNSDGATAQCGSWGSTFHCWRQEGWRTKTVKIGTKP